LAAWEKKFYNVQQDALKQIPRALAELDARLGKVLAETAPKEMHTVASGVQADKAAAALPPKQRVRDTPGKVLAKVEDEAPKASTGAKTSAKPKLAAKAKAQASSLPLKETPDPIKPPDEGTNTKKQAVADAAAAVDRERITKLSNEAREARLKGDEALATAKIDEARGILKPYLPKGPAENWDDVIDRLDVSSPKDGAVFWSGTADQARETGQPDAARAFAEKIGGVTLETTPGGRIIDNWDDLKNDYAWDVNRGPEPWTSDLWSGVSEKYANGATGDISLIQTPDRLWSPLTIWHKQEKPTLLDLKRLGQVNEINIKVVNAAGAVQDLPETYIKELLKFDQRNIK